MDRRQGADGESGRAILYRHYVVRDEELFGAAVRGCGVPGEPRPDYALLDRSGGGSVFYPRGDSFPPPAGASDHLIEVEPGIAVAARFYTSDPSLPTVPYFHRDGEVASDHDDIAPLYHEAGVNLFVAEFRGYGKSGGRPSLAGVIADCRPIVESFHATLDQQGFDARRFVMGRSLGTHAALGRGAQRRRPAGWARSDATPTSVWLAQPALTVDPYTPHRRVARWGGPRRDT